MLGPFVELFARCKCLTTGHTKMTLRFHVFPEVTWLSEEVGQVFQPTTLSSHAIVPISRDDADITLLFWC